MLLDLYWRVVIYYVVACFPNATRCSYDDCLDEDVVMMIAWMIFFYILWVVANLVNLEQILNGEGAYGGIFNHCAIMLKIWFVDSQEVNKWSMSSVSCSPDWTKDSVNVNARLSVFLVGFFSLTVLQPNILDFNRHLHCKECPWNIIDLQDSRYIDMEAVRWIVYFSLSVKPKSYRSSWTQLTFYEDIQVFPKQTNEFLILAI